MTSRIRTRLAALASVAALAAAIPAAAVAGPGDPGSLGRAPQGFDAPAQAQTAQASRAPQGFGDARPATVKQVLENAADKDVVTLRGRFTKHLKGDKYEFVDETGEAIAAELDDDRDWSMVRKDALMEIRAKVDREWRRTKLDVKAARPVK